MSKSKSKSPLMSETELQDLYKQASDMEVLLIKDKLTELPKDYKKMRKEYKTLEENEDKDYKKMRKEYQTLEETENEILERQKDYQLFKKAEILVREKNHYDKKIQDNIIELRKIRAEKKK